MLRRKQSGNSSRIARITIMHAKARRWSVRADDSLDCLGKASKLCSKSDVARSLSTLATTRRGLGRNRALSSAEEHLVYT